MTVSEECADVSEETVAGWLERLKFLIAGHKPIDTWNTDETDCFFRALLEKTMSEKAKECRGGKVKRQKIGSSFLSSSTLSVARSLPL